MSIRVALCQLESVPPSQEDNISSNLLKIENYVRDASERGCDLVVFPEYCLHGVVAEHLHLVKDERHFLQNFIDFAIKYRIDIVPGSIVEKSLEDSTKLFNNAYYIDRTGIILHTYQKRNLWHSEKEYLTASTSPYAVFETEKFRAGLLLCWDLTSVEAFRAMMKQGVEVVIVPTCWVLSDIGETGAKHDPNGQGEAAYLDSAVIARAYENECCVIFVNCGGSKGEGFLGRSAVSLPFKGAIGKIDCPDEKMEVVEVDLSILKDAREIYKMREEHERNEENGTLYE